MLTALWKNLHKTFILTCSSKLDSYSSNKPQSSSFSQSKVQSNVSAGFSALCITPRQSSYSPMLFAAFILAYLRVYETTIQEVKVTKWNHLCSCCNGKENEYICYCKCKKRLGGGGEGWQVWRHQQVNASHLGKREGEVYSVFKPEGNC